MKVFCDTNIIVAAILDWHPHHGRARPVLERVVAGKDKGFIAAHTLAEAYSVVTRLPSEYRISSAVAWRVLSENILKHFSVVALTAKEYADTIKGASENAVEGGRTYDVLLLAAAKKSGAERIYTLTTQTVG